MNDAEQIDIWDLKYISTSDEEDNDSDMASEDESEEENQDEQAQENVEVVKDAEDKALVTLEGGKMLPPMFKHFKKQVGSKKQARVQYEYRYSNDPDNQQEKPRKTVVVKKCFTRKGPQNMIDVLIYQKLNMYEREERMRLLKAHDDSDWQKM